MLFAYGAFLDRSCQLLLPPALAEAALVRSLAPIMAIQERKGSALSEKRWPRIRATRQVPNFARGRSQVALQVGARLLSPLRASRVAGSTKRYKTSRYYTPPIYGSAGGGPEMVFRMQRL